MYWWYSRMKSQWKFGCISQEAERTQTDQAKEAVDVAVLAVEKPQENVKEAFSGGQNGRFIPAPKIFYNLFKKDDRPKEDKSWLDRVTDSIIDKLELRWEDDEEARMEVRVSGFQASNLDHDKSGKIHDPRITGSPRQGSSCLLMSTAGSGEWSSSMS